MHLQKNQGYQGTRRSSGTNYSFAWVSYLLEASLQGMSSMLCGSAFELPEYGADYLSNFPFLRLTLGLMGLDELHLRVLATSSDDPREQANAKKGVDHDNLGFENFS